MKKTIVTFIICFTIINAYGQNSTRIKDSLFGCTVLFTKCQVEAKFKEGETAYKEYIDKNINVKAAYNYLPKSEKRKLEKEAPVINVYIHFTVNCDGKISNIQPDEISNNIGAIEESRRLIMLTENKWEPGRQNSSIVKSIKMVKITFNLFN